MGAFGDTLFEVIRADVVDNTKKASAAIVKGIGVMISGNGTVSTMATTATLCYGIAMEAAASGQAVPILIEGVVSIKSDDTTCTLVGLNQGANMTYGTLVYISIIGQYWSTTTDGAANTAIIGRVINETDSTADNEVAEVYVNCGAYFTPTE